MNNCFHYLGRVFFARYDFKQASLHYVKSQFYLEQAQNKYNLSNNWGSTAFYHLRLGQVLEASGLLESADYHYHKGQQIFFDSGNIAGQLHISLARANLIGSFVDDSKYDNQNPFKKREEQINLVAKNARNIGYNRGHLEALLRLFILYLKSAKLLNLIRVGLLICTNFELYRLIFANPNFLILKFQLALGLYGMGPYHRVRFYHKQKHQPRTILKACPCNDPECKNIKFDTGALKLDR